MKKILVLILAALIMTSAVSCSRSTLSKEVKDGIKAFNSVIKASPERIGFHKALSHWGYKIPSGGKFEWTKDMSANKADFAMVIPADPFINAGLDVNKLNKDEWMFKQAGIDEGETLPNLLVKPYNVSDKKQNSNGSEDALRRILTENSSLLSYHKELQHYRLMLGEGYEVQWTEKLGINDADMIFVLKAQPLIDAGLDVKKLEADGWIFKAAGQDPVMGSNPDQLMKIFKLK